jgi:hypothetical protein
MVALANLTCRRTSESSGGCSAPPLIRRVRRTDNRRPCTELRDKMLWLTTMIVVTR